MCKKWSDFEPCKNFKCPNNLFWEDLKLNREKIRITDKALELRNCCCFAAPIERRYSERGARALVEQAGCRTRASAFIRGWAVGLTDLTGL